MRTIFCAREAEAGASDGWRRGQTIPGPLDITHMQIASPLPLVRHARQTRSTARFIAAGILCLGLLVATRTATAEPLIGRSQYTDRVQPLLAKYCYDCHGDGAKKGEFALDEHGSYADLRASVGESKRYPVPHELRYGAGDERGSDSSSDRDVQTKPE